MCPSKSDCPQHGNNGITDMPKQTHNSKHLTSPESVPGKGREDSCYMSILGEIVASPRHQQYLSYKKQHVISPWVGAVNQQQPDGRNNSYWRRVAEVNRKIEIQTLERIIDELKSELEATVTELDTTRKKVTALVNSFRSYQRRATSELHQQRAHAQIAWSDLDKALASLSACKDENKWLRLKLQRHGFNDVDEDEDPEDDEYEWVDDEGEDDSDDSDSLDDSDEGNDDDSGESQKMPGKQEQEIETDAETKAETKNEISNEDGKGEIKMIESGYERDAEDEDDEDEEEDEEDAMSDDTTSSYWRPRGPLKCINP